MLVTAERGASLESPSGPGLRAGRCAGGGGGWSGAAGLGPRQVKGTGAPPPPAERNRRPGGETRDRAGFKTRAEPPSGFSGVSSCRCHSQGSQGLLGLFCVRAGFANSGRNPRNTLRKWPVPRKAAYCCGQGHVLAVPLRYLCVVWRYQSVLPRFHLPVSYTAVTEETAAQLERS